MDVLKSVTSSVKSCSSDCSMVIIYLLMFLSLPIDKFLNVDVQQKVRNVFKEIVNHKISKLFLTFLLYVVWTTKDVMLLTLYLFLLGQIGQF